MQAVPTIVGSTDQKVPFPEYWAGRFMIAAENRETAIKACKMAQGKSEE